MIRVCLSVCLSVCPSVYLSIHQSINLSIYLFIHVLIYTCIYLYIYIYIYLMMTQPDLCLTCTNLFMFFDGFVTVKCASSSSPSRLLQSLRTSHMDRHAFLFNQTAKSQLNDSNSSVHIPCVNTMFPSHPIFHDSRRDTFQSSSDFS